MKLWSIVTTAYDTTKAAGT